VQIQNISGFPIDVLGRIFTWTQNKGEPKNLAPVSRRWNETMQKKLADLFEKCGEEESLKPYTEINWQPFQVRLDH